MSIQLGNDLIGSLFGGLAIGPSLLDKILPLKAAGLDPTFENQSSVGIGGFCCPF